MSAYQGRETEFNTKHPKTFLLSSWDFEPSPSNELNTEDTQIHARGSMGRKTSNRQRPCSPGSYHNSVYFKKRAWINSRISNPSSLQALRRFTQHRDNQDSTILLLTVQPFLIKADKMWLPHGWHHLWEVSKTLQQVQFSPSRDPWFSCEYESWSDTKGKEARAMGLRSREMAGSPTGRPCGDTCWGREGCELEGHRVPGG